MLRGLRLLALKCLKISKALLDLQPSNRDVAQLVECTSGGREAASSSLVIPTFKKAFRKLEAFFIAQHLVIKNRFSDQAVFYPIFSGKEQRSRQDL